MNDNTLSNVASVRFPELDGLRAIAILLVLLDHQLASVPVAWLRRVMEMGWVGVDLFFVLSGFLIGGILLDHRAATNCYGVFYLRRFFRIVPLYAVILLPGLLVLGFGLQAHFAGHSLADEPSAGIWFHPFFLQNIALALALGVPHYLVPTWSVAVEEQFYLLLPPLVRRVNEKKLLKILALAILVAPVLRGGLILTFGVRARDACYVLLPCRWDALLLGVACACAFRSAEFRARLARQMHWLQLFWCLSAAGAIGWLFHCEGRLDPRMAFLGYSLIDACFAGTLLLAVMHPHGSLHHALSWPAFKPVATYPTDFI